MENQNAYGLSKVKNIVAVSSCKGGVGKSTVAVGMARALTQMGKRVGLLDADIYGPSLPTLFDLKSVEINTNDFKMIVPVEAQGMKLMSFGFILGDAPAVMRGPIVTRYIQQMLFQTEWGELDYLILDMPPGTGDVQLTITQSVRLSGAVIVTTRQSLSLVDVARGILMFEKLQVPVLGVVDNMAYFTCDACSKKHYVFGEGHTLEKRFGIETLVEIPLIPSMDLGQYMRVAVEQMIKALERRCTERHLPKVSFDSNSIQLKYPDGKEVLVKNHTLRANCMCAVCVNEITGAKLLDPRKIPSNIVPKEITPLGNYALGVSWSDGHSSGIYPYILIESLAGQ